MNSKSGLALAISLVLVGCQAGPLGMGPWAPPGTVAIRSASFEQVLLKGQIALPASFGFQIARLDDKDTKGPDLNGLLAQASVYLVEYERLPVGSSGLANGGMRAANLAPGNNMNTALGRPQIVHAAGVTDDAGNFTLYKSTNAFVPVDGRYYQLEVIKRWPTRGGDDMLLSMRTVIKRDRTKAKGWDSLTGEHLHVNLHTSALLFEAERMLGRAAKAGPLDDQSPADVTAGIEGLLGMLGGPAYEDLSDDHLAQLGFDVGDANNQMADRVHSMTVMLAHGIDPVGTKNLLIQGDVYVRDARAIQSLIHIEEISGNLEIDNTKLETIELPLLKVLNGALKVVGNQSLVTLRLPKLVSLQGADRAVANADPFDHGSYISGNPSLQSIELPSLKTLGWLWLEDLRDLSFLGGVTTLAGLKLGAMCDVPDLTALGSVTTLGALEVKGNQFLVSLQGLEKVTKIGRLEIENNTRLTFFEGLENVTRIDELIVKDNRELRPDAWVSLGNLESVGKLDLAYHDSPINLDLMPKLTQVCESTVVSLANNIGHAQELQGRLQALNAECP